jgi:hypothetical protein
VQDVDVLPADEVNGVLNVLPFELEVGVGAGLGLGLGSMNGYSGLQAQENIQKDTYNCKHVRKRLMRQKIRTHCPVVSPGNREQS